MSSTFSWLYSLLISVRLINISSFYYFASQEIDRYDCHAHKYSSNGKHDGAQFTIDNCTEPTNTQVSLLLRYI